MNRIPTLDGWRGIAIAMVLFDHVQHAIHGSYSQPWMQTGLHGVTIFFVLSGFLITSKLLEGPINLKKFYLRRFFRLMPAAWLFLAALLCVDRLTGIRFTSWAEIRACLFFYRNFVGSVDGGGAGHFWSLSVEEQFYLVWPCVLVFGGAKRCRWIAAAAAIGCATYRWLRWSFYDHGFIDNHTEVRADALLIGCLLALLLVDRELLAHAKRLSKICALPAAVALFGAIYFFHLLQPLWESVSIAVLITATMLHPSSIVSRLLSWKPLAWLGTISYSLYVWQAVFMGMHWIPGGLVFSLGVLFPLFALGSYYLVERPCTRLGHKLTAQKPARMDDPSLETATITS